MPDRLRRRLAVAASDDRQRPGAGGLHAGGRILSDGQEAWDYLAKVAETTPADEISQTIGCIVSDIEMPRMDGFTLTRRVRENAVLRELPVILFSSLISKDNEKKGRQVGRHRADLQAAVGRPHSHPDASAGGCRRLNLHGGFPSLRPGQQADGASAQEHEHRWFRNGGRLSNDERAGLRTDVKGGGENPCLRAPCRRERSAVVEVQLVDENTSLVGAWVKTALPMISKWKSVQVWPL